MVRCMSKDKLGTWMPSIFLMLIILLGAVLSQAELDLPMLVTVYLLLTIISIPYIGILFVGLDERKDIDKSVAKLSKADIERAVSLLTTHKLSDERRMKVTSSDCKLLQRYCEYSLKEFDKNCEHIYKRGHQTTLEVTVKYPYGTTDEIIGYRTDMCIKCGGERPW